MKHNNNNHPVLILQAWPLKLCKNQKKATYFKNSLDQSALKKLTEEPLPTKKVRRRKKVLAEKERASIRALYLTLRVIYFSNLSNGFEIN